MKRVLSETGFDQLSRAQTIGELTTLYNNFTERLRECADFKSDGNTVKDLAVERMENDLQNLQDDIVNRATKITLKNKQDLKELLDFWHVVTVQNAPDEISPSDRIIMNIRDYYEEALLGV